MAITNQVGKKFIRQDGKKKRKSYTNTKDGVDSSGSAIVMATALLDYIKSKSSDQPKTFRQIATTYRVSMSRLNVFHGKYKEMKSEDTDTFTMDKNGIIDHKSLVWMLMEQPSNGKSMGWAPILDQLYRSFNPFSNC
jgi:hypothetical protein